MDSATKSDTVYFSIKGQVVIPRWLRRQFEIEEGTRAHVMATPQGILIKPVTRGKLLEAVKSAIIFHTGSLRRKQ